MLCCVYARADENVGWDTSEYMNAPEHGQVRGKEGVVAVKKRDHKPPAVSHA